MSFYRFFCPMVSSAIPVFALLTLLTVLTPLSIPPALAQQAAASPSPANAAENDAAKPEIKSDVPTSGGGAAPAPTANGATAPANQASASPPANPPQPKTLTGRAIDKVKEVAKTARDIFSRVPCLPPKGGAQSMGSLPHVAS